MLKIAINENQHSDNFKANNRARFAALLELKLILRNFKVTKLTGLEIPR